MLRGIEPGSWWFGQLYNEAQAGVSGQATTGTTVSILSQPIPPGRLAGVLAELARELTDIGVIRGGWRSGRSFQIRSPIHLNRLSEIWGPPLPHSAHRRRSRASDTSVPSPWSAENADGDAVVTAAGQRLLG